MTNEQHRSALAAAEAAQRAACARLAELDADNVRAQQAAADAQHAADRALTRAAVGEAVGVNDLGKLRAAAAKAADAAGLASALRDAGQRRVDETQVALFQANAADLAAQQAELTAAAREAAAEADRAVEAAQAALERLRDAEGRCADLRERVRDASFQLDTAGRTNAVLQEQHRSVWPRFAAPETIGFRGVPQIEIAVLRRGNNDPEGRPHFLRGGIAAFLGMAGLDPNIAASLDLQAKLRAAGTAQLARIAAAQAAGAAAREGIHEARPIQRHLRGL